MQRELTPSAIAILAMVLLIGCVQRSEQSATIYCATDREFAAPILDAFERAHFNDSIDGKGNQSFASLMSKLPKRSDWSPGSNRNRLSPSAMSSGTTKSFTPFGCKKQDCSNPDAGTSPTLGPKDF
jgi:hypothetical protein